MSRAHSSTDRFFLSCDWGTSAFRLRLVRADTLGVVSESQSAEGISATFAAWKNAGAKPETRREHYAAVLRRHLADLRTRFSQLLEGVPLVISGMASSSIGFQHLEHQEMPIAVDGSDLLTQIATPTPALPHPMLVISGVRTGDDVMRGEETQLVGALHMQRPTEEDRTLLFPGTHSKHIRVVGTQAVSLRTFMTGEFFHLLSEHSILAASVARGAGLERSENLAGFVEGVTAGAQGNLLHASFRVRTRSLLDTIPNSVNYHFLSGLVVGNELKELANAGRDVTIVGTGELALAYEHALRILYQQKRVQMIDSDHALLTGQRMIARRRGLL